MPAAYGRGESPAHRAGDLRPRKSEYQPQFRISISGKYCIKNILIHLLNNPLLGFKKVSYLKFYETHKYLLVPRAPMGRGAV